VHRNAKHHFGFAGARRSLEQKLERTRGEIARDRFDRRLLIDGKRERLVFLDQLVRACDEIFVLFDLLPYGGRA
jgi:hypothetical protein